MRRTILAFSVFALVFASCGGGTEQAKPSESTTPGASASVATTTTGSPTASPTAEVNPDYEVPPYEVPAYGELVKMYDYDTSEPLGYKVIAKDRQEGATVYSVEYRSSGYAVPAYLVIPDSKGPFPAVLYAHGNQMNRAYFLTDALAFAREGYAGLLIGYPGGREPYAEFFTWNPSRNDIKAFQQYVIDLRRGLDLLESLSEIDASRIGFVGHSIGGWVGSILSGVEDRIDAYVLTAVGRYGSGEPGTYVRLTPVPGADVLARYQRQIAPVYPVNYVGHNRGAALLFQASRFDEWVSTGNIQALFEAAGEPKMLRWYPSGHMLGCMFAFGADSTACPNADIPNYVFHRAWLAKNV